MTTSDRVLAFAAWKLYREKRGMLGGSCPVSKDLGQVFVFHIDIYIYIVHGNNELFALLIIAMFFFWGEYRVNRFRPLSILLLQLA